MLQARKIKSTMNLLEVMKTIKNQQNVDLLDYLSDYLKL